MVEDSAVTTQTTKTGKDPSDAVGASLDEGLILALAELKQVKDILSGLLQPSELSTEQNNPTENHNMGETQTMESHDEIDNVNDSSVDTSREEDKEPEDVLGLEAHYRLWNKASESSKNSEEYPLN